MVEGEKTAQTLFKTDCEQCRQWERNLREKEILNDKQIEDVVRIFHRDHTYKHYTWQELRQFEKEGVEGNVCTCDVVVANSMTLECLLCGKIQRQYAKSWAKRQI